MIRNKKLCSRCKTGQKTYQLDPKASCPYLIMYHDGRCGRYEKIKKERLWEKVRRKIVQSITK